ncbi:hypothetical protein NVP1029O_62 [Vibrio phage 1.029.O._10N.261.55.A7]|nr:hypothetical protein NVP1029O_62 [Vibrio phage 1.029.O._10N.261.55.A7]
MKDKKKSFLLHIDSLEILDSLSDEQVAKLFRAIKSHHCDEKIELDEITKLVFFPFKQQFARDAENYNNTCNRNKINGLKGGRPKKQHEPKETQKTQSVIEEPKKADSDSDNDKDNKKDNNKLDFSPLAFSQEEIKEFKVLRAKKKAAITQRVIDQHGKQFDLSRKRGYSNDDILNEWSNRGWASYKDEWMKVKPSAKPKQPVYPVNKPTDYDLL